MIRIAATRVVAIALALLAFGLFPGCDSQVYTDQEIEAQRRFESIKIGATEAEVLSLLGRPTGTATRSRPDELMFEFDDHGVERRLSLQTSNRAAWPADLQFMSERPVSAKLLVFKAATVTAYYFIGSDERVEHVDVFTS
jgi:hypothetical protein